MGRGTRDWIYLGSWRWDVPPRPRGWQACGLSSWRRRPDTKSTPAGWTATGWLVTCWLETHHLHMRRQKTKNIFKLILHRGGVRTAFQYIPAYWGVDVIYFNMKSLVQQVQKNVLLNLLYLSMYFNIQNAILLTSITNWNSIETALGCNLNNLSSLSLS